MKEVRHRLADASWRDDLKTCPFAHLKEAERMIQIGIRQKHTG
jgi:hypothetical protein